MANGRLSDTRVEIVDSHAAAGASGLIALAAAGWASQGLGLDQIVAKVGELIPKVHLIAFLDSLWYLSRSGRVGKFDALAGTLLSVKPLAELRMGVARILEKPRSRAKAVERLLATMGQRVGSSPSPIVVNIMEANSPEDAFALSRRIRNEFDCADWFISQLTPVMGVHTGPGLLGVAFHEAIPS
jgi:DegV family protein with EDD domain